MFNASNRNKIITYCTQICAYLDGHDKKQFSVVGTIQSRGYH